MVRGHSICAKEQNGKTLKIVRFAIMLIIPLKNSQKTEEAEAIANKSVTAWADRTGESIGLFLQRPVEYRLLFASAEWFGQRQMERDVGEEGVPVRWQIVDLTGHIAGRFPSRRQPQWRIGQCHSDSL